MKKAKKRISVSTLILCTSREIEDKTLTPTTITASSPETIDIHETAESMPQIYKVILPDRIFFRKFFINESFAWRQEANQWVKEFLPQCKIKKIMIISDDIEAIKFLCKHALEYKRIQGSRLILSDKSYRCLRKYDPKYLESIQGEYLSEKKINQEQSAEERYRANMIDRIRGVAQSTHITPIERRLYLYFLGKNSKASDGNLVPIIFDYDLVANDFIKELEISRKDIVKAVDRLKKRGLISFIEKKSGGLKFVLPTDCGPVDLIASGGNA
jgi:DNA-binding MarR family transcriptional regulator